MLELINETDVNKLSLRKPGKRFLLYQKAIKPHIKEIEDNITKSEDGFYRIGENTLRNMLGEHLRNNSTKGIFNGLQYCLWKDDIVVWVEQRIDRKKNYFFRRRVKSDTLPIGLQESDALDVE